MAVMDIDILLVLQAFREGVGGCITSFLSKMTWFGEMEVVLIFMGLFYIVFLFPLVMVRIRAKSTSSAATEQVV